MPVELSLLRLQGFRPAGGDQESKSPVPSMGLGDEREAHFVKELKILKHFKHDNIIAIKDIHWKPLRALRP
uniref:Uncharacterized protein n=1 Tax=Sphaerodactylus townsendi TaxID=933632 RepID=A0ACB8EWB2_9SAUR